MYSKQTEQNLKAEAARINQTGGLASAQEACAQPGLRERVGSQLWRAQNEASRAERLRELAQLLDKNPEVARILDLIEEVRG